MKLFINGVSQGDINGDVSINFAIESAVPGPAPSPTSTPVPAPEPMPPNPAKVVPVTNWDDVKLQAAVDASGHSATFRDAVGGQVWALRFVLARPMNAIGTGEFTGNPGSKEFSVSVLPGDFSNSGNRRSSVQLIPIGGLVAGRAYYLNMRFPDAAPGEPCGTVITVY